ncbi:pentatricopeptide repeat-containing protein At1g73710-like isoform X1 [Salvia splendens]|uniref:pentatricopeptide repeat-containing protein At1g73710-like isoform X1 n=3 Tax=Salvia splendens TaxID=180675 RepID=UPI001C277BEF|nr:pentatricopeptide repeat-containing protein At1g73710-like isoform X1 [Salvia splendens]XP_042049696.1 pentatricopeptide repeat-containing protein At1g73710-like isoform X1 [Salvia splendens]
MMLQCCGSSLAQASTPSSSPCKLRSLRPTTSSLFWRFSCHQYHGKDVVFLGFKLQCLSKDLYLSQKSLNKGKKKKYGGVLPVILRELGGRRDVETLLDSYCGKLNPKEQTLILKEQSRWDKVIRVFNWFKSQQDYTPNVIHYNVVLRALGRAQKWNELRLCWIEMSEKGVVATNNTYGMLVDVYGKAGLVKEALLWIKHMKLRGVFPDEVTMSTVIKVLKDAGEFDKADKFYKDWCVGRVELDYLDFESDEEALSLKQFLLTELFRSGGRFLDFGGVEESDVTWKPRLTNTYNTLIDLYGKAGRLEEAAGVLSDMLKASVPLDVFTFNTMIFICGSEGHLSEAEALLDAMEERGIRPDTKTCNIFLKLYADLGDVDAALGWFRKIREFGLFPDDATHRVVIKILSERNMVEEVESVIQEIERFGKCVDQSSLPLLAKMYVGVGMNERVKLLIERVKSRGGFSSRIYAALLDVYAENGLWAEAEALFYGERDGFGQKRDVLEYNVMIKAYGKAQMYDKAIFLFKSMRNQGTWPDECTYNSIIQMLAAGGLADRAREFLNEMMDARIKPSCLTFSAVIARFAEKKSFSIAIDVLQEMLLLDVRPNEIVYGSLINAFAEDGKFEEANEYFKTMEDSGISPNQVIMTSMIKAYGKIGSVEGARGMYERMQMLDGGLDIVASNSMLNVYAELGVLSEAEAMYDHLRETGLADGVTFATMILVYKNMGMLDSAIEVAEQMRESGFLRDCVGYNKVMACYAAHGQLVECGKLLQEMVVVGKVAPNKETFKVLFTVLKKGGVPAEAVRDLQTSYYDGRPFAKQAVLTSAFSIVGLHAYALEWCGIFRKEEVGLRSNASAYNAAIRAYVAYGKIDDALKMFMRMQDEGVEPDVVTLINLVHCYGRAGMVEGVKRVHSQLKHGEVAPSEALVKAVVEAYKNTKRPDLAELITQEMKLVSEFEQFADCGSEDIDERDIPLACGRPEQSEEDSWCQEGPFIVISPLKF